jgi:hypothetical protein
MLSWFRARAPFIARVALLSLLVLTARSAAPHEDDCHDSACADVSHDPSSHSIGRESTDLSQALHCVLCHWTRSFRSPTPAAHLTALAPRRDLRLSIDVLLAPQRVAAAQPPLRAPPPIV